MSSATPTMEGTAPSPALTPTPTGQSGQGRLSGNSSPLLGSDPNLAELQTMFPSIEVSVIEIVLESCGGSQDRAIEQLLSMTDPSFKPDELQSARREEESQLDLDAQFARSLQIQDEEEARAHGGEALGGLPYQPRVRRNRQSGQHNDPYQAYEPHNQQQSTASERDGQNPPGMLAVEEKLGQFAEAGRQTFNSLWSKAKSKYSEFQAQQAQHRAADTAAGRNDWGADRRKGASSIGQPPGGGRGGQQNHAQRGGLWEDSRSFDSRSESFSSESTFDPPIPAQPTVPLRQSTARWQPSDAYDDPLPPLRPVSGSSAPRTEGNGRPSPGLGSSDKPMTGKIDAAKLGILPKKRVDLLSTSPNAGSSLTDKDDFNPLLPDAELPKSLVSKIPPTPPATSPYRLEDSDDELEYTKNPFDEK